MMAMADEVIGNPLGEGRHKRPHALRDPVALPLGPTATTRWQYVPLGREDAGLFGGADESDDGDESVDGDDSGEEALEEAKARDSVEIAVDWLVEKGRVPAAPARDAIEEIEEWPQQLHTGVVLDGSAMRVRDTLERLAVALGCADGCATADPTRDDEKTPPNSSRQKILMRIDMKKVTATTARGRGQLEMLAAAMAKWIELETTFRLVAVDVEVADAVTVAWLVRHFPTGVAIGVLAWKGETSPERSLLASLQALLNGSPERPDPVPVETLVLRRPVDGDTFSFFCTALRGTRSVQSLVLDGVLQDYGRDPSLRAMRWRQFALAIFSERAAHKIRYLHVQEWGLQPEDMRAVVEVLRSDRAALMSLSPSLTEASSSRLQLWNLWLGFGEIHGDASVLAELLFALRGVLPITMLNIAVKDDPGLNDAVVASCIEAFAPTLRDLRLRTVELDSLASVLRDGHIQLQTLLLRDLFLGDLDTCEPFFKCLTTSRALPLEILMLELSRRHPSRDANRIIRQTSSMLQTNTRIAHCELRFQHKKGDDASPPNTAAFAAFDGDVHELPLWPKSQLAFLSVFSDAREPRAKKPRLTQSRPSRPDSAVLQMILGFAAARVRRVARIS